MPSTRLSDPHSPRQTAGPSPHWDPLTIFSGKDSVGSPGGTHPVQCDGDTAHAVWAQAGAIRYRRSDDCGCSWSDPVALTSGATAQYPCSLERWGSVLQLIWPDDRSGQWEIWEKRSADSGATWGGETRLTPAGNLFRMGTAMEGNTLHVVWGSRSDVEDAVEGRHAWGEIYYKRSTDGGRTWDDDLRLTVPESTAMRPSVASRGRFVHVTWFDRRHSKRSWDWDIYYKRSTDRGVTWGPDVRMNDTPWYSLHPQIAATPDGRVCCIWEDGGRFEGKECLGETALYAAVSTDDGATWGEPRRISFVSAPHDRATHSKCYASGSRIFVAWTERRRGPGERHAVYFVTSPDGGLTWSPAEFVAEATDEEPHALYAEGVAGADGYALVLMKSGDVMWCRRRAGEAR